MRRRPNEATSTVINTAIVALLFLLQITAASQHDHHQQHDHRKVDIIPSLDPLQPSKLEERDLHTSHRSFKDTVITNDASAIATLAPASLHDPVVRAPPAGLKTSKSAGLSSLLNARSLQDWEVEDFVLLATVDGKIHARDRKTGAYRWAWDSDRPMVETIYHRQNRSESQDSRAEDDFLWIIEPSRDGALYIYSPGPTPGLQKLGLTVKKLVEELSPYAGEDPSVVYTGEKRNTLYTVDARTGHILKTFSSAGSTTADDRECRLVGSFDTKDEEACGSGGILTIGRTEYTVGIASRDTGDPVCTLKYTEWGPNNRDSDLHSQYFDTMDRKYVYSRHDGSIFGFDHAQIDERRRLYTQKLSSPVARVFDIARPHESDDQNTPLVILPQPIGPTDDDLSGEFDRDNRIFVNCTEFGGWYAMSETTYPLVTGGASQAQCYNREWLENIPTWDQIQSSKRQKALVGIHPITTLETLRTNLPSISGPESEGTNETPSDFTRAISPSASLPAIRSSRLLGFAAENLIDITLLIPLFFVLFFFYSNRRKIGRILAKKMDVERLPGVKEALMSPPLTPAFPSGTFTKDFADGTAERVGDPDSNTKTLTSPKAEESPEVADVKVNRSDDPGSDGADTAADLPKKKKTHRGQRGGAGRKKGKKDLDQDNVNRIIDKVKDIERDQPMEPDILKVNGSGAATNDMTEVSGPFQINNLIVTDTVLGYGSHGTIVYKGSFEGRDVAVKRMLLEFFDVASHEVSLLQESDDHPNVIRYFCRQQSAGFLYIALELCPASLQDVVEKPYGFTQLAQASQIDLPNVLYQIAAGVRYLHSLKIVHRDLKPQNILVAAPKIPRNDPNAKLPPRLLISDFGLCKKLDGDQSSFRATTAHAAGTSGWRAPELLVDDDASPQGPIISEGGHSVETSEPAVIDSLSNRRATRAIDIFSLGCVFFYILSRGNHPFGDRYMREANIVKGQFNLDQLQVLGDSGYEADDLIRSMLSHDPRRRQVRSLVVNLDGADSIC
jgi:serine/threonine-protein kinase/endoribonuclease IRE1